MKLKRVRIYGFKTFAEKTEFDVDGDIIAVVGPNGCGKSNIVDAILWALGESNTRNLRAQTSQEVIFAGSVHRKPLGFAEVSLHFENEDGGLPVDAPEVSVSRRLTRSGESEYRINRRTCRLRDVNDLLADSGLGRAGYAIVGQSEIDQALAASPQQRRGWIDEAAGVQRYRARRTEALRRLESADQHLRRVEDILGEIESQRAPLEAEAETARRYKAALHSLREVECGLLVRDLAGAVEELLTLEERVRGAVRLVQEETARAEALEAGGQEAAETLVQLEAETEAVRAAQTRAQTSLDQAIASLEIAQGKLESLDVLESSLQEETEAGADRTAEAERDVALAAEEDRKEADALDRLRQELAGADDEARRLTQDLKSAESALVEARARLAERQRHELERAHREERAAQIRRELQGILASLPDLAEGIAEAEAQTAERDAAGATAKAGLDQSKAAAEEARAREDAAAHDARRLMGEAAVLDGKRRGIEATIESHEGLAQGPRAVLDAVSRGELKGQYLPVGEAVELEPEHALAIEAALGASVNDLIVPDEGHAERAIAMLKDQRLGRATFQPVPLMRPPHQGAELRNVLRERGVVGLASELVNCDPAHRPVVESLLGRVVVAEDLETALRLARTNGWSRLVTLDGEVVHGGGAVTGGRAVRTSAGIVQRKAELAETEAALQALGQRLAALQTVQARAAEERARIDAGAADAAIALEAVRLEAEESRSWLLGLRHELTAAERERAKLEAELGALSSAESGDLPEVDVASAEAARDGVLKRLAAKSADAESAEERLREAEERARAARQRHQEAGRRRDSLRDAVAHRARRTAQLEPERERLRAQIAAAEAGQRAHRDAVEQERKALEARLARKRDLIADSARLGEEARAAQKAAAACAETAHHGELARTRTDARRAATLERLLTEYGVTQDEAVRLAPGTEVPEDAPGLVARLRRDLKGMGDVNLGAIEAYERLTERHDELAAQRDDVLSGRSEIEASVRELDRLTRERFLSTFERLQVAFADTFRRIFGGGEGVVELVDSHNVLDSGVEIQVTVPGKRRQRLELLSGGERAMSAIAFLFALLRVKPSPLVILDEVDAPLDGRNVERFIATMREFTDQTQFILITHNDRTICSADVWFGVTMQEPGVSTLVPVVAPPAAPTASTARALVDTTFKG